LGLGRVELAKTQTYPSLKLGTNACEQIQSSPYSWDLNPIELLWAGLKRHIRKKEKERAS
jgi:hypothetical protein